MKSFFEITKDAEMIFPQSFAYKEYEKHVSLVHPKDTLSLKALEKTLDLIEHRVMKNLFSLYHFYLLIPKNIQFANKTGYDGNVKAAMITVARLSDDLYANLLDLKLVFYLKNKKVKTFHEILFAKGEQYFEQIFYELKDRVLSFENEDYPSEFTEYVSNVLTLAEDKFGFDIPILTSDSSSRISESHHQILNIVTSSIDKTFKIDDGYYNDIIRLEEKVKKEYFKKNSKKENNVSNVGDKKEKMTKIKTFLIKFQNAIFE